MKRMLSMGGVMLVCIGPDELNTSNEVLTNFELFIVYYRLHDPSRYTKLSVQL